MKTSISGIIQVGGFTPANAGGSGPMTVITATALSVNAAYVGMASELDLCDIRTTAEDMGVTRADGNDWSAGPSMVIGSEEVAPLDMANAYATVAAEGIHCDPTGVDSITRRTESGSTELELRGPDCDRALPKEVADAIVVAMTRGLTAGTVSPANPYNGMPLFGKTGTTAESNGAVIAVASPKAATFVWMGTVIGHESISSIAYNKFVAMKAMLLRIADLYGFGEPWDAPPADLVNGVPVVVPDVTGLSVAEATENLETNGFIVAVSDETRVSTLERGLVAEQSPGAGSRVTAGSMVTLYRSDGSGAELPDVTGLLVDEAIAQLTDAGFSNIATVDEMNDDAEPGTVLAMDPEGLSVVSSTQRITLTVAVPSDDSSNGDGTGDGNGTGDGTGDGIGNGRGKGKGDGFPF